MVMKRLSPETIKLISSTQVITSVSSVVKELLENAIDAHATTIEIRLENYGLDKIEVRDNGSGISHNDVQVMCLRGYTSKISDISDLSKLTHYGFRGEALSSICAVADVTVITKSNDEKYGSTYTMDNNGQVINSLISHHQKGTIIQVTNLFKKLPVRKQIYSSKKHCINDLRKVEYVVKSLSAIQQNIRVSLCHDKHSLWYLTPVNDLILTYGQIWSSSMTKYVKHLRFSSEEVEIDIVLPIQNIDVQNCFFTTNIADAIYLYVNKRPIRDNKIEKLIVGELSNYFGHYLSSGKYLPCLVNLTIPTEKIDINLEPDKSRILFHSQEIILLNIKNCINKYYYNDKVKDDKCDINEVKTYATNKRKISSDSDEIQIKKPAILTTQLNDSFVPNAESTKIINNNLLNSDVHTQIINELSLEDIDFDEPIASIENESNETCSKNNLGEKNDISEYLKTLKNVGKLVPLQNIQSDNTNVINFNAENISISQWSKGEVVLNEKLLESGVSIKSNILHETLEKQSLPEIKKASKILHSDEQKDIVVNNITSNLEDKTSKDTLDNISTKSIKIAPLFRVVSVPDEQVPGLNHLVNRPQSWVPQPRSKRLVKDIYEEDLSETVHSVSSQMGKKEMSGFTLFAKETRIKILQENPGLDFTKVSKELARLWGCLNIEEKENYKKMAIENKKIVTTKKSDTQIFTLKNLKRYSTSVNVELSDIKNNIFKIPKKIFSEFILIGKLEETSWVCCVRNKVQVVNVCRLQEAVIFFQKLATDVIPLKILDQPIKISKRYLGEHNYDFLKNLQKSYELSTDKLIVTDERIVKNGFNVAIECTDDSEIYSDINITDVALHISIYGAEELKQLLELMQMEDKNELHCCRPLKVVNYIRSETVRFCKSIEIPKTKDKINNLLEYWFKNEKEFSHNTCIHNKNVFTTIHTIDDDKSR